MILGFVIHFTKQIWVSFRIIIEEWAGRLILLFLGLLLPTGVLTVAHTLTWYFSSLLACYLSVSEGMRVADQLLTALEISVIALLAISVYVISCIAFLIPVRPIHVRNVLNAVSLYFQKEGSLAAHAIVRAYSLFGMLIIAIPIVALLPGSNKPGVFFYVTVCFVLGGLVFHYIREGAS